MNNLFEIENLNIKTLKLLRLLYEKLNERGLQTTSFNLKVYNKKRNYLQFVSVKDLETFKIQANKHILTHENSVGYNLIVLQYIELTNGNLERYGNKFKVDTTVLNNPKYIDIKLRNNSNQIIIDREIERYKRLVTGLLNDYDVAYRISLEDIITRQDLDDTVSYVNYVNVGYVLSNFVKPQQ